MSIVRTNSILIHFIIRLCIVVSSLFHHGSSLHLRILPELFRYT